MAKVHIVNVVVLDNPSSFSNPFQFEITFECIEDLKEDLEWKIIYVGSAESEAYDQTLDTVYVGPVPEGKNFFKTIISTLCFFKTIIFNSLFLFTFSFKINNR